MGSGGVRAHGRAKNKTLEAEHNVFTPYAMSWPAKYKIFEAGHNVCTPYSMSWPVKCVCVCVCTPYSMSLQYVKTRILTHELIASKRRPCQCIYFQLHFVLYSYIISFNMLVNKIYK